MGGDAWDENKDARFKRAEMQCVRRPLFFFILHRPYYFFCLEEPNREVGNIRA